MMQSSAADDDALYLAAVLVEQDDQLNAEVAEWESATINDGLAEEPAFMPKG